MWEVYLAVTNEATQFEIMLHADEHDGFWERGLSKSINPIMEAICSVDAAAATASKEEDRVDIFERMQGQKGIHHVNWTVITHLREWFVMTGYKHICDSVVKRNQLRIVMCNNLAVLLTTIGRLEEAEHLNEISIEALSNCSNESDDPGVMQATIASFVAYGNTLSEMCHFGRAQAAYERALALQSQYPLACRHRQRLMNKALWASTLSQLGRPEEAGHVMREVMEQLFEEIGADDPDFLECCQRFATTLQHQGLNRQAVAWYERCLAGILDQRGLRSKEAIAGAFGLASALRGIKQMAANEKVLAEYYPIAREIYGDDHRVTAHFAIMLTNSREDLGIEPPHDIVARVWSAFWDEKSEVATDHTILKCLQERARIQADRGEFDVAETSVRHILNRQKQVLPYDHEDILESMYMLGHGILVMAPHRTSGRLAEAERILAELLRIGATKLGPRNEKVLEWLNAHADLLLLMGRYSDAEAIFRICLDVIEVVFGKQSLPYFSTLAGLSAVSEQQGNLTDAYFIGSEAMEMGLSLLGSGHPIVENLNSKLMQLASMLSS